MRRTLTYASLWCWVNSWGNIDEHNLTSEERIGYRKAIKDVYNALADAGISATNEEWKEWNRTAPHPLSLVKENASA